MPDHLPEGLALPLEDPALQDFLRELSLTQREQRENFWVKSVTLPCPSHLSLHRSAVREHLLKMEKQCFLTCLADPTNTPDLIINCPLVMVPVCVWSLSHHRAWPATAG